MFKSNFLNREKFKGIIIGSIVTGVMTTSLFSFASMENLQAFFNNIGIKINGKAIDTGNDKPFVYNGRTYVPARYIAEALGATVKWNESSNTVEIESINYINLNNSANLSNKTSQKGNIKGIITWQYNDFIGTKADTGAKISLIPTNLKPNSENDIFCLLLKQISQGKNGIYSTDVDGYGNYEIQDIPVGKYYLLINSKNTNSDMTISEYDEQHLKSLFTDKGWENMKLSLKLTKYELKEVEIKDGKTITESYDFGNTNH